MWDNHYAAWLEGGAWQALARSLCKEPDVIIGFYHYSENSIPIELGLGATLGSYSPRAFRGGCDLGGLSALRVRSACPLCSRYVIKDMGSSWWKAELTHCRRERVRAHIHSRVNSDPNENVALNFNTLRLQKKNRKLDGSDGCVRSCKPHTTYSMLQPVRGELYKMSHV